MRLLSLLTRYSVGALRREIVFTLLGLSAIALAVTLFVSIRLANQVVLREFQETVDFLSGTSALQIVPRSESFAAADIVPLVRSVEGVEAVFPLRIGKVWITDGEHSEQITLLGIDILHERLTDFVGKLNQSPESSEAVFDFSTLQYKRLYLSPALQGFISEQSASFFGEGGSIEKLSVSLLESDSRMYDVYGEKVAIGDLSLVDFLLGDPGLLTGVNLYLAPAVSEQDIREQLVSILPQNVLLTTPELRSHHLAKTSEALRVNLVFLSALSLFVAVLFGFQIVSLLLLRRRRDVATLVSVGASPSVLSRLVMGEALTLGLLGGLLGGFGGYLLGEYTIGAVRGTINTLYIPLTSQGRTPDLSPLLEGAAIGAFIGVLSGLFPALTVQTRAPLSYFSREHSEQRFSLSPKIAGFAALFFALVAYGTSEEFFMRGGMLLPFLSPTALSTAVLLTAPLLLLTLFAGIRSVFHILTPATQIGVQNLKMRLGDSALAVGALAVTFGLLIGVSTMVSSFRVTFNEWLETVLSADLFLTPQVGPRTTPSSLHAAVNMMNTSSLTKGVQSGRQLSYVYEGAQTFIRSIDAPLAHRMDTLVSLGERELRWQLFESGTGVVVSESFSRKLGVTSGDMVTVMGADREHIFEVAGVIQDFSSDLGAILIDQECYKEVFGDVGIFTGVSVFLHDAATAEEFLDLLEDHFPDVFQITDRQGLREMALKIFDGTFAITYVLQLITTVIASLFLILLLITSVLDSKSEQLTLRSIGSPFSFLRRVLISESITIVASAALLGVLFGLLLSCLLVYRVNIVFFGWTVAFVFPWELLGTFLCGVFVMAVVVPAIVAHYTLREIPVEVLRYE